jgi:hypothetical protein
LGPAERNFFLPAFSSQEKAPSFFQSIPIDLMKTASIHAKTASNPLKARPVYKFLKNSLSADKTMKIPKFSLSFREEGRSRPIQNAEKRTAPTGHMRGFARGRQAERQS